MGKVGTGATGFHLFDLVQTDYSFKNQEKVSFTAKRAMPVWITATTPGGSKKAFVSIMLKPKDGGENRIATEANDPSNIGGASYATASGTVVLQAGDAIEVSRNTDAEWWTNVVVVAPEKVEFQ